MVFKYILAAAPLASCGYVFKGVRRGIEETTNIKSIKTYVYLEI